MEKIRQKVNSLQSANDNKSKEEQIREQKPQAFLEQIKQIRADNEKNRRKGRER